MKICLLNKEVPVTCKGSRVYLLGDWWACLIGINVRVNLLSRLPGVTFYSPELWDHENKETNDI